MKKVFILFVLLLSVLSAKAQQSNGDSSQSSRSISGTYQIQVINSRNKPYIPGNLEELVTKNRHETKINYVALGTEVRLMILPLSAIKAADFKELPQIGYIKEQ